jgi:hypothetical protein
MAVMFAVTVWAFAGSEVAAMTSDKMTMMKRGVFISVGGDVWGGVGDAPWGGAGWGSGEGEISPDRFRIAYSGDSDIT